MKNKKSKYRHLHDESMKQLYQDIVSQGGGGMDGVYLSGGLYIVEKYCEVDQKYYYILVDEDDEE